MGQYYSDSPTSHTTSSTPRPVHLYFYCCWCHYTHSCNFSLQQYHPILLNLVSVFVAPVTSCQKYCRRVRSPTHPQVYFLAVSGFTFEANYLNLAVLPLDSCSLKLALEKSFVSKLGTRQRSQDATWSCLIQ